MTIDPGIFRAYDIRGIVDKTLTEEAVKAIGQAVGSVVLRNGGKSMAVGRDGRLSSPKLFKALTEGIISTGCNVEDIGVVPTPLLYYATCVLKSDSGIMITGSHNPPEYNGLKIVLGGKTLAADAIQNIYKQIQNSDFESGSGSVQEIDLVPKYIERICSDVKLPRPLKVVIDCGNGVASVAAGQLYRDLGCEVHELFCNIDGTFPNHHPDPGVLKNLQDLIAAVKEKKADIGLAFDGDADRLGVITNKGEIIFADRTTMLLAQDVLSRNPGAKIVYDVKSSHLLTETISKNGGEPIMCKTGHSFLKAKIRETGAALGGELSGHIFFKERWYGFDDAIYSGARLLEVIAKQDLSSSELFATFPNTVSTPELKLPISEEEKFTFMDQFAKEATFPGANVITIDGLRVEYPDGWGLIRPSNTTPYLILRFEANDEKVMKRIQDLFKEQLLRLRANLELPF